MAGRFVGQKRCHFPRGVGTRQGFWLKSMHTRQKRCHFPRGVGTSEVVPRVTLCGGQKRCHFPRGVDGHLTQTDATRFPPEFVCDTLSTLLHSCVSYHTAYASVQYPDNTTWPCTWFRIAYLIQRFSNIANGKLNGRLSHARAFSAS